MVQIENAVGITGAAELGRGDRIRHPRCCATRGTGSRHVGRLRGIAIADVEKWIATPRKRGPKPKKKT